MKTTRPFLLTSFCAALCIAIFPSAPPARAQEVTEHVYAIGGGVTEPKLQQVEVTPSDSGACRKKLSGKVTFSIVVDTSGHPRNILFVKPLGTSLDKLALTVVKADQFQPATRNGAPVAAGLFVEVKLKGCMVPVGGDMQQLRLVGAPRQSFTEDNTRQGEIRFEPSTPQEPIESIAQPFEPGNGVTRPELIFAPEAKFTNLARREGITGACLISVIVDTNGLPRDLRVIHSVDNGLDHNALAAVSGYRFKPAMKNGEPVPVTITVEVNFRLYYKHRNSF
ncbi:MAG: energy transducer TonB [Terracidiphilus sp.]